MQRARKNILGKKKKKKCKGPEVGKSYTAHETKRTAVWPEHNGDGEK